MLSMPTIGLGASSGDGSLLVSSLGTSTDYNSIDPGSTASITFTLKTDGTWTVTGGSGDALLGAPTSGTWLLAGGVAADHEVIYSNANDVNTPTVTNGAAAYTAVSANRTVLVSKASALASTDLTVNVRKIGTTSPVLAATFYAEVDGAP